MAHWTDCGIPFTEAHHDADIIWGPGPAEMIAEGKQRLIARLYAELRRHPSEAEVNEQTYGPTTAPEIIDAIAAAAEVFRADMGRNPTCNEVLAGLLIADTKQALLTYLEREIQVGDTVMWAERDDNGEYLRQDSGDPECTLVFASGTVTDQSEGWLGTNVIARDDDGTTASIGRERLIKVLTTTTAA